MMKKQTCCMLNALLSISLLFALTFVSGCMGSGNRNDGSGETVKGNISISGAFALYPLTVRWAEEFHKKYPDIRIDISAGGAGKGMADALSEMVDLGMFSRGLNQAEIDQGAWWIAVTKDAVLPTVNAKNPFLEQLKKTGVSKTIFQKVFISHSIKTWNQLPGISGQDEVIHVYTRSDACGAAQMWGEFLGKNQESLEGIGVFGDPGMADAVKNDPHGTGYNNMIYVFDISSRKKYNGLEVIPVDINENGKIDPDEDFYDSLDEMMKAIKDGKYPAPPARDLFFVAHGKPTKQAVLLFLRWILTDGQQYVNEAGYVQLSDDKIRGALEKLPIE
nr:PstS family phosphate ABC transporter substrate-binding protein [Bacteroidota bacterium]